ncbi:DinB family protein [Candidatus Sumerlaeota bacterium]|nr:DinB family protein [Candidatus Sumerlaeota bacterium]
MTSTVQSGSIAGCLDSCAQARGLVGALTADQYAVAVSDHSSIGAHMRHCMDHFLCFFRGLEDEEINYDARDRNALLETDPQVFHDVARQVVDALIRLDGANLTRVVTIRQIPAPGCDAVRVTSTIDRELLFLMSHCIHHVAVVKVLARAMGVTLPADLGVAYSTVAWKNSTGNDKASG